MEFSVKEKVLFAFFIEYQKDIPEFGKINAAVLEVEKDAFLVALVKLESERLIKDIRILPGGNSRLVPADVYYKNVKMTNRGIQYVEKYINVFDENSKEEKLNALIKKASSLGWKIIESYAVKVLVDLSTSLK